MVHYTNDYTTLKHPSMVLNVQITFKSPFILTNILDERYGNAIFNLMESNETLK